MGLITHKDWNPYSIVKVSVMSWPLWNKNIRGDRPDHRLIALLEKGQFRINEACQKCTDTDRIFDIIRKSSCLLFKKKTLKSYFVQNNFSNSSESRQINIWCQMVQWTPHLTHKFWMCVSDNDISLVQSLALTAENIHNVINSLN